MLKVYSESNELAKMVIHFTYYHGMAEEIQGHDLVTYVESDLADHPLVVIDDGIHPVMMVDNNGKEHQALLFRWSTHGMKKGLVVLITDAIALLHAIKHYDAKSISV
jgi:hypothetical protein